MKCKKGKSTVIAIILTVIAIGIILGVGYIILEDFEDTLGTDTGTVINESVSPTDAGVYVTANYTTAGIDCYNDFVVTSARNQSLGEIITTGNYSVQSATGRIQNLTNTFSTSVWNVSYTYQFGNGSDACSGVGSTITATNTVTTWLPTIILLVIVGVLFAIVMNVINKRKGTAEI